MNTQEWENIQNTNKHHVITSDTFDINDIIYVGGVDISFDKNDNNLACAYLTIFNIQTNKIVYEDYLLCTMNIPYISGFLGFREIPQYKQLLLKIKDKSYFPQIILVDGFGILHQREFGSASQLGLELDIPTIGVGKSLCCIDGINKNVVNKLFKSNCKSKGDFVNIVGKTGKNYGVALKSSNDSINPIYVSIGHKISLDTATQIVLKTCLFKNPEPIRNSDIKSKLHFNEQLTIL